MKVLQINCVYNEGSTGKIVHDLHRELQKDGYESIVCYGNGRVAGEAGVYRVSNLIYEKFQALWTRLNGVMYGGCVLSTMKTVGIIKKEKPDIVHLHCLNGHFVNIYRLITWLKNNRVKTVLTLHAEFMHTANCGYALDCEGWKSGCGHCPRRRSETKSYLIDGTNASWKRMKKAFDGFDDNLTIVSVSPWLMDRAKQSPILADKNHRVVYNGIDTDVFRPYDTAELRHKYNLTDEKIVFHATPSFNDDPNNIKGGFHVLKLAEMVKNENIKFFVAGPYPRSLKAPDNVVLLGKVDDQIQLAKLYSMADVTLLTSKKETFSMIVAESLCCGTPVVGFEAGAPETISIPAYSAFVEQGNTGLLAAALKNTLQAQPDCAAIACEAREKYESKQMNNNYLNIYREMSDTFRKEIDNVASPIKLLAISVHPIDSMCPIGYTKKNIFSNPALFQIMEIFSCAAYCVPPFRSSNTSESLYIKPNSLVIRPCTLSETVAVPGMGQEKTSKAREIITTAIKAFTPCVVDKALLERVRDFGPDVIYTEGYDIRLLKLAYSISKKLGISIVTHTMDDWFSDCGIARFFQRRAFQKCAATCSPQLAISMPMMGFLKEQFHLESDFVGNCVDFSSPDKPAHPCGDGEPLNITFTGNLTPGRFPPIVQLVETIDGDEQLRERVKLHIYAPQGQRELCSAAATDKPQLVWEPYLKTEEIPAVLRSADILLHTESFNEEDKRFTRYSLSTKTSEYLSSKTPIMYFGPLDVGAAEFLRSNDFAFVTDNPLKAVEYLHLFMCTEEAQLDTARDRFERAKSLFQKDDVQKRMYAILSAAAKSRR